MDYPEHVIREFNSSDLHVDAIYQGGFSGRGKSDEVIHRLLPGISNSGGFRVAAKGANRKIVVLYSSGSHLDWPDEFDPFRGTYRYFGDNRTPGRDLHDTPRAGNRTLKDAFALAAGSVADRLECPIFLLFEKVSDAGHDVRFLGLAVPGSPEGRARGNDLVAIWKTAGGVRFQNYRAILTVLDTGTISGEWVREVIAGNSSVHDDPRTPAALTRWAKKGEYLPLRSQKIREGRTRSQQTPDANGVRLIETIREFCPDDFFFEVIAAEIWRMSVSEPADIELTRRSRDGGRDAVGQLWLGPLNDRVAISFSLEAKNYAIDHGVGVKEISRLISRLRHRELGVLVTTSYLAEQAYDEVRADGHPIVVISGVDIVQILASKQITTADDCKRWLETLMDPRVA